MFISVVFLIFVPLVAMLIFPLQAQTRITAWRQNWQAYLERKYGERAFSEVAIALRKQAKEQKLDMVAVERVLHEQKSAIVTLRGSEILEKLISDAPGIGS